MANYILVAGTYHGGWYWDPIVPQLEAAGHSVCAPTLSGLDPQVYTASAVNLDSHIEDVLRVINENSLSEVILVGWSYGGMVLTGVADRAPEAIKKLIYLDGQLPGPGQREWDLLPPQDRESTVAACLDGINLYPDEWLLEYEPRTQPHPIATKLQPLDYDQGNFDRIDKVFVFAEKWFHNPEVVSPLKGSFERAGNTPGWQLHAWPYGHDLVREAPEVVSKLLLEQA